MKQFLTHSGIGLLSFHEPWRRTIDTASRDLHHKLLGFKVYGSGGQAHHIIIQSSYDAECHMLERLVCWTLDTHVLPYYVKPS